MRLTRSPARRRGALVATPLLAVAVLATLPGVASAHYDHAPPTAGGASAPFTYAESGGEGAVWEPLTSIPTGNPHSDLDFFTQGGETFASVGTLAAGLNGGGQSIIQLTEGGKVSADTPAFVSGHGSATCLSSPDQATALQHDAEATPKGATINNDSYLPAVPEDAQLIIDTTDGPGRCHDQGELVNAPNGGLEIIDITDVENPVEIALTAHVGESHTVNIDPKRPHIAYAVTSDAVSVTRDAKGNADPADDTFTRNNDPSIGTDADLDGFEVVDMSSCMYKTPAVPAGTLDPAIKDLPRDEAIAKKRADCKPEVYRYRYDNLDMSLGYQVKTATYGCHELKPYPNDTLTCGSGSAAIVFDMSGAFDAAGKPQGEPLDCLERDSTSLPAFQTDATITDCTVKSDGTTSLSVPQWLEDNGPALTGVKHVGSQQHIGRAATQNFATTIPATEDIDFNHEAEFSRSGRFLFATDERGGGVAGGAQCTQGTSNEQVNGGVHAYRTDKLTTGPATTKEQADAGYAQSYTGDPEAPLAKAIYRAPTRTGAEGSFCTAHVFQQAPEQNRIFMGWYTQGTQVIDYVELPGNKLQMLETGYAIPVGTGGSKANTWTSAIFKMDENPDGSFTYYGATGDIQRLAIDVYKVTLPAPLEVCDLQSGTGEPAKQSGVSDRGQARGVHVQNVDCVLNYKISQGKTLNADGTPATYAPTERVTRGQMASFIANALIKSRDDDGVLPAGGSDQFTDIGSNTHRVAINRLARAGIVRGLTGTGGRFAPEQLISRDQMASFITGAARFAAGGGFEPTRTNYFGDVPVGNVHERNISAGFENGLLQGTVAPGPNARSGLYAPTVQVQRDQMATFLVRLFKNTLK